MSSLAEKSPEMLIGALLRVPAQAIHRRLIKELNVAGFDDLRLPHIAVLQYPGPDGQRPGVLAERAGVSKQAMNQLLGSLEDLGYITRSATTMGGRMRIVRLTPRGQEITLEVHRILRQIEQEWIEELGVETFRELKRLLMRVWESPLVLG